jgi:putative oxidoreductase
MKDPLGFRSAGILVQRVTVGGLMLFHGVYKIFNGVEGIQKMLEARDLPGFFAYGVYLGEVLGPLMMILGFKARIGAALVAFTMIVSIPLAFSDSFWKLTDTGGPVIELNLLYLLGALAIVISGSGMFSLDNALKKKKKSGGKKKAKSEE